MATKAKLEKVAEIKRLNNQVMAIKRYMCAYVSAMHFIVCACITQKITVLNCTYSSDISRNEEQLNELKMYRQFLYNLAPQEWREKHHDLTQQHSKGSPVSEAATEEVGCTYCT